MPQTQLNAFMSLACQLPAIAKQLRIANQLKALELKRAVDPSVKAPYEWTAEIDRILKAE